MYLVVGLGNPGQKYENTRHNVGYRVIDVLAKEYNIPNSRVERDFQGLLAGFFLDQKKVILCEPLTFMNLSGDCVKKVVDYYKIPLENLIVIYDDIDIPLGEVRVKRRGGPGTHNGMKSIVYSLESTDFPRIRVGTGPVPEGVDLIQFVLSRFPKDQVPIINKAADLAAEAATLIITEGVDRAMYIINSERVD